MFFVNRNRLFRCYSDELDLSNAGFFSVIQNLTRNGTNVQVRCQMFAHVHIIRAKQTTIKGEQRQFQATGTLDT